MERNETESVQTKLHYPSILPPLPSLLHRDPSRDISTAPADVRYGKPCIMRTHAACNWDTWDEKQGETDNYAYIIYVYKIIS